MKTTKLFGVWQYDREAAYLETKAHQGWRLVGIRGPRYEFKAVSSLPGTVKVDYQASADIADDRQLMQDAGWQLWLTKRALGGQWLYWYHEDPHARIYSDTTSLIELMRQLRRRWTAFGFLVLVIVGNASRHPGTTMGDHAFWTVLVVLGLVNLGLYGWNFAVLTYKIRQLRSRL